MSLAVRTLDDPAPLPLSFPSILRNPGIQSRYAYLSDSGPEKPKPNVPKKHKSLRRDDNEGKRWIRRKENARFSGNIHIVQPGKRDILPPQGPEIRSTFPEPLPVYLARNNKVPTAAIPTSDPRSADCGRFSISLRGMRRDLRKQGFRSRLLVLDVETQVVEWLQAGGIILSPDAAYSASPLDVPGVPVGNSGSVVELSRTPLQLIWRITDDAFARYVVHCTARYYKIVSFSKEVAGQRLTYLLRPNVTYPEFHATMGLDTPPATDIDLSSQLDTDSEFASDHDIRSDAGDSVADSAVDHMSTIEEDAVSSPHIHPRSSPATDDDWSVVGDDTDGDESGDESAMGQSINSLSGDPDGTMVIESRLAHLSLRSRAWAAQGRSTSSPSRSPVRPPRRTAPIQPSTQQSAPPNSFYEYLFS
ncbi:hypothetical protein B0H11DRAFT_1816075 [Mycena galericulata]|nr:hypothetical protein B0H11DRAFT_1816075 [Mycena galericulata]